MPNHGTSDRSRKSTSNRDTGGGSHRTSAPTTASPSRRANATPSGSNWTNTPSRTRDPRRGVGHDPGPNPYPDPNEEGIPIPRDCTACGNTGWVTRSVVQPGYKECSKCYGVGTADPYDAKRVKKTCCNKKSCRNCDGDGWYYIYVCTKCEGAGKTWDDRRRVSTRVPCTCNPTRIGE